MSEIAIRTEGLSKRYRIGQLRRHPSLRDLLEQSIRAPFRALRRAIDGTHPPGEGHSGSASRSVDTENFIWALRNVSLQVRAGEVVGIIGSNGSGKSTLLKLLSRVTRPTAGHADVRGRVGSLLDVGTGFHPELTGRENTFLSGAILGMTKAEIAHRFNEMVAFAEVEKFIDTPVKHYSTGMFLRLAFSVAAHLEHEILLVDEILAAGDAAFQRKCLQRIANAAKEGRTVLYVSHQLEQVRGLCQRSIWLDAGSIRLAGPTSDVISHYEEALTSVPANSTG